MSEWIASSETLLRLSAFIGALGLFSVLETLRPRRRRQQRRAQRWVTNLGMVAAANLLVRALALGLPLVAGAAAAVWAAANGIGLFNLVALPGWLAFALAIVALDFAVWLQHVISHRVPLFWRFHAMHHADLDFDATTALRFHPVEIAASALYKMVWVFALGPSVAAVIVFDILLNACAIFNHSNLALPRWLDRGLRLIIVTPDMHRVHHSDRPGEHHRNFGFCLSVWDRLFNTYRAQPALGHERMEIGLGAAGPAHPERFSDSLAFPWRWQPSAKAAREEIQSEPSASRNAANRGWGRSKR